MGFFLDDLTRLVRTKVIECECGCWYWTGSCDTSGYSKFKLRGKTINVHRYAYERLVDAIPDGMTVDHLACTSRRCVNPGHMQLVTRGENSTRANATRWHDVKFDVDGVSHQRQRCPACVARDNTATMGFGSHPENISRNDDWHDSDAVAQSL